MFIARGRSTLFLLGATSLMACAPSPRAYRVPELQGPIRAAVVPFTNYSGELEAVTRIAPMVTTELAKQPGLFVIDAGRVEDALSREPWLLTDRLPLDIVQRVGAELNADVIVVGSVLGYGYRDTGFEGVPQVSLSLRMVDAAHGRVLWSSVHSRDGDDREWLFGWGRVHSLEQLATELVEEMLSTFPEMKPGAIPEPAAERTGGELS